MVKKESDLTGGLGSNGVGSGFSNSQALLGEIVMTFLLMYVVLETAVSKTNNKGDFAPIAIGFAVYLGHVVLIPIDGCSINPTRSFGPAVVATVQDRGSKHFEDFWVFARPRHRRSSRWPTSAMTKAAPEVPPEDTKIELPSRDESAQSEPPSPNASALQRSPGIRPTRPLFHMGEAPWFACWLSASPSRPS
ncbi:water channel [Aureococcus anophagefferens]|nr:water channel [Aureococcus anophagefferens]